MTPRPLFIASVLLLCLLGSQRPTFAAPSAVSTGLVIEESWEWSELPTDGRRVALPIAETPATGDLNGDGDASDYVLHVYDGQLGTLSSVGISVHDDPNWGPAFRGLPCAHGRVAWRVGESGEGFDLNGDGDVLDVVPHVLDLATGAVTSAGVSTDELAYPAWTEGPVHLEPRWFQFVTAEVDEGVDLNGDFDVLDRVVEVLFLAGPLAGTTRNLGHALSGGNTSVVTDGRRIAFLVLELHDGPTDWSGDGDTTDTVIFLHGLPANNTANSAIMASALSEFDGSRLPYLCPESFGGLDLNGDGDLADRVTHFLNTQPPVGKVNTGIAVNMRPFQFGDGLWQLVFEPDYGADLNGDGLLASYVTLAVDMPTATTWNLSSLGFAVLLNLGGVSGPTPESLFTPRGAFGAGLETGDQNGDGDANDALAAHLDLATGLYTTLPLAGTPLFRFKDRLLIAVREASQGNADLNGDGDTLDSVLHVHDIGSGAVANLGLVSTYVSGERADRTSAFVEESLQGLDLNGDGDASDYVAYVVDLRQPRAVATGLAVERDLILEMPMVQVAAPVGRRLVFVVVSEADQGGTDLNGDGDALDQVLHVVS